VAWLEIRHARGSRRSFTKVIADHDGSAKAMREILRGLAAASDLAIEVSPFARELSKRLENLERRELARRGRTAP